ncbi:hypothetical protein [Sulfobacillus thermosulfidooxidans]|nr:hypothetical protein [Sulfobacillus thermosulfidooxidans]
MKKLPFCLLFWHNGELLEYFDETHRRVDGVYRTAYNLLVNPVT